MSKTPSIPDHTVVWLPCYSPVSPFQFVAKVNHSNSLKLLLKDLFVTIMDAFGDDFGETPPEDVSAAFSDDPAADFLAREQEELGDLGEELGLSNGDSRPNIHTEDVDFFQGGDALADTGDAGMADDFGLGVSEPRSNATPSPQLFLNHPKPKEEPETIRKWREDYARLLQEKDQRETVQMEDLRNQAKKELSDW